MAERYYSVVFTVAVQRHRVALCMSRELVLEWQEAYGAGERFMVAGAVLDPYDVRRVRVFEGVEPARVFIDEVGLLADRGRFAANIWIGKEPGGRQASLALATQPEVLIEAGILAREVTSAFFKRPPPRQADHVPRDEPSSVTNIFHGPVGNAAGVNHGTQTASVGGITPAQFQSDVVEILGFLEERGDQLQGDLVHLRTALATLMAKPLSGDCRELAVRMSAELEPKHRRALQPLKDAAMDFGNSLAANATFQAIITMLSS